MASLADFESSYDLDLVNYTNCQEIGRRVSREGHPLLKVPSARQDLVNKNTFFVLFSEYIDIAHYAFVSYNCANYSFLSFHLN